MGGAPFVHELAFFVVRVVRLRGFIFHALFYYFIGEHTLFLIYKIECSDLFKLGAWLLSELLTQRIAELICFTLELRDRCSQIGRRCIIHETRAVILLLNFKLVDSLCFLHSRAFVARPQDPTPFCTGCIENVELH